MAPQYEIRADYDARTIVFYQAYSPAIADAALRAGRFVAPFSFHRMTWIKPSFMWLMHRSNWARKPGQERVLAVRINREGWEEALSQAVLTTADPAAVAQAAVHVQWDPERSPRGAALNHYSIQVGIGRHLIRTFTDDWIVSLTDLTPPGPQGLGTATDRTCHQGSAADSYRARLPTAQDTGRRHFPR